MHNIRLPMIGTESMVPVMLPIAYFSGKEKVTLDFYHYFEVVPIMPNLDGPEIRDNSLEGATPFNI